MKISLTTKNNLIHIGVIMIMISIIVMISVTNARYETVAKLSGKANFPNTVLKVTPLESNNYNITVGNEIKLQYEISNNEDENINTNNLRYYLEVIDENGLKVEGFDIKICEMTNSETTFDTATSMNYTDEKGFGPETLKCDGNSENTIFDVFFKYNNTASELIGEQKLKLQVYAESITNENFHIIKTVDINLNVINNNNNNNNATPFNIRPNAVNTLNNTLENDINENINSNNEENIEDEIVKNQEKVQDEKETEKTVEEIEKEQTKDNTIQKEEEES